MTQSMTFSNLKWTAITVNVINTDLMNNFPVYISSCPINCQKSDHSTMEMVMPLSASIWIFAQNDNRFYACFSFIYIIHFLYYESSNHNINNPYTFQWQCFIWYASLHSFFFYHLHIKRYETDHSDIFTKVLCLGQLCKGAWRTGFIVFLRA